MTQTERGSALPLMLVICCLTAVCLVGLTHIGEASVSRARVDAVADVVALAGVGYGHLGAQQVAEASQASLVSFDQTGPTAVQVTVQLSGVRSTAAADALGAEFPDQLGTVGNPDYQNKPR